MEQPAVVPYMVTIVELSNEGSATRYTIRARHWSEEVKKQHEQMGFHQGWRQSAEQLEALARTL